VSRPRTETRTSKYEVAKHYTETFGEEFGNLFFESDIEYTLFLTGAYLNQIFVVA
jgi:hypothetical protein